MSKPPVKLLSIFQLRRLVELAAQEGVLHLVATVLDGAPDPVRRLAEQAARSPSLRLAEQAAQSPFLGFAAAVLDAMPEGLPVPDVVDGAGHASKAISSGLGVLRAHALNKEMRKLLDVTGIYQVTDDLRVRLALGDGIGPILQKHSVPPGVLFEHYSPDRRTVFHHPDRGYRPPYVTHWQVVG